MPSGAFWAPKRQGMLADVQSGHGQDVEGGNHDLSVTDSLWSPSARCRGKHRIRRRHASPEASTGFPRCKETGRRSRGPRSDRPAGRRRLCADRRGTASKPGPPSMSSGGPGWMVVWRCRWSSRAEALSSCDEDTPDRADASRRGHDGRCPATRARRVRSRATLPARRPWSHTSTSKAGSRLSWTMPSRYMSMPGPPPPGLVLVRSSPAVVSLDGIQGESVKRGIRKTGPCRRARSASSSAGQREKGEGEKGRRGEGEKGGSCPRSPSPLLPFLPFSRSPFFSALNRETCPGWPTTVWR